MSVSQPVLSLRKEHSNQVNRSLKTAAVIFKSGTKKSFVSILLLKSKLSSTKLTIRDHVAKLL